MSLFNTLLRLNLKNGNNPYEDFLTEVFSYVLKSNPKLLSDFLMRFQITEDQVESYQISTQVQLKKLKSHDMDSRPDMVIYLDNQLIFFENKLNSKEGYDQLKRYAEHLDDLTDDQKTLVYITKNFDTKNKQNIVSDCKNDIDYIEIRWYNIYNFLLEYKETPLILELLHFMQKLNLAMNHQFTPSDIITLTNFKNVLQTMEESMSGEVSELFNSINNGIKQNSTSMTQLRDHDRYIYSNSHINNFWCGYGYWLNSKSSKDYPDVGTVIEVAPNSPKRNEIIATFKLIIEEDNSWVGYNLSNPKAWAGVKCQKSLQHFLSQKNQIEEIKNLFKKHFLKIEQIFAKHSALSIK